MNSQEINTEIESALKAAHIQFKVVYIGEVKNAFGNDEKHISDKWVCTFVGLNNSEGFDFYTGLGLRKPPLWKRGCPIYDGCPAPQVGTMLWAEWQKLAKPEKPHPADVLYSVFLDMSACQESFEQWADNYGYNTDSRKALKTYEACNENGNKVMKIFSKSNIKKLEKLLQEY